jgi:UDP-glucose 4-epimerase
VVAAFFKRVIAGQPVQVFGDGSQVRDFVYIDDLCDGLIKGLMGQVCGVVQLGSGRPVSVSSLIEAMRLAIAPHPIAVKHEAARAGEVSATWCDITKARALLGFSPDTVLQVGLQKTWLWFAAQELPAN